MARKHYRRKRKACGVCKPGKRGITVRWTPRQLVELKEWERQRHLLVGPHHACT